MSGMGGTRRRRGHRRAEKFAEPSSTSSVAPRRYRPLMPTDPVITLLAEVLAGHPEAVTVADAAGAWAQVSARMRDGSAFYIRAEALR
jgi:hypothetical protein